jgi:hypothetical protein
MSTLNIPVNEENDNLLIFYLIPHFTIIHVEKDILSVLPPVQQKNCLWLSLRCCLQSKGGYKHTVTEPIHVVGSTKCGNWKARDLDNYNSRSFSKIASIQIFDFSTLYTTIPYENFKTHLKEIIHNAFYFMKR